MPRGFEEVARSFGTPRILDFGCGFGRSLVGLLAAGHDVWGVDVSRDGVAMAQKALGRAGLDPQRVALLDMNGRSPFPDESFDLVFSEQVLEHVADLGLVVQEIARLLKPGGATLHQWPPRWRVVEPHISMPLVHWLPKNRARYACILTWAMLGVGTKKWPSALPPGAGRRAFARARYAYSIEQTFYRSEMRVARFFVSQGLQLEPVHNPRVEALPAMLRPSARWAVRTFKEARLQARKPGPPRPQSEPV